MVTLALYKMAHRYGAIFNCVIVCIYRILYVYALDEVRPSWLGMVILYGIFACDTVYHSAVVMGYAKNCRNYITKKSKSAN